MDKKLGRILKTTFELRSENDYGEYVHLTTEEVNKSLEEVLFFISEVENYILSK